MRAKKGVVNKKLKIISVMQLVCNFAFARGPSLDLLFSTLLSRVFLTLRSTASCANCKRVARYMVICRPGELRINQFGYYQRTIISS